MDKISRARLADYIINEADGAARKPIKAPNATEPVIPAGTTLTVAVVGMDALGAPLLHETALRPELITRLTGLPAGGVISREVIATLITDAAGIIQYSPPDARIVPFINKAELARSPGEIKKLARAILSRRHPRIGRVAAGSLQNAGAGFDIYEAEASI